MNHQDKFWQAFQDKVKSYSTDEYSSSEWAAMEELLAPEPITTSDTTKTPTAAKAWWIWGAPVLLLLLAAGALYWAWPTEQALLSQPEAVAQPQAKPSTATDRPESFPELAPTYAEQITTATRVGPLSPAPPSRLAIPTTAAQLQGVALAEEQAVENPPSSVPPVEPGETAPALAAASLSPVAAAAQAEVSEAAALTQPRSDLSTPVNSAVAIRTIMPPPAPLLSSAITPLTTTSSPTLPSVERAPNRVSRRWQPSLIMGGSLAPTNTGRAGQVAGGPLVGLALRRNLSPRWSIEVEAVVRAVVNYNLTLDAQDSFINPTGGQAYFHREVRTIEDYVSFDFPIVLHYAAGSRWAFSTGLRYSYLEPMSTSSASSGNIGSSAEVIARVSQPQLWQNDFGFLLGVSYGISRRWSVQVRYTQSWVDLSPDNLYQDNKNHLNSDLQFTARKSF